MGCVMGYDRGTATSGPTTIVTVAMSFINTCREGPAVSLHGSPTVSPVTAALCASLPLPPKFPASTCFLALSQAPPPLFRKNATSIAVIEEHTRKEVIH